MTKTSLRRRIYLALDPRAGPPGRLSTLNRVLMILIFMAVAFSIAETEPTLTQVSPAFFESINFVFGMIFLTEYCMRLWTVVEADHEQPWRARLCFVFSVAGIIDLITVLASLVPILGFNSTPLRVIRIIRIVRLSRLGNISLAIMHFNAAIASRRYELLLTLAIGLVILLLGSTTLYWIEGDIQPDKFGSIPRAMWWAVVTLTTIGYGDVYPITPLGKFAAAAIAIAGVGVIALPTGILAAAFSDGLQRQKAKDGSERTEAD
jgi:voltage-gated potassium channel